MLFCAVSGKRVKEPSIHITSVHSVLKIPNSGVSPCYFGIHLLVGNTEPVALVESEKTALVASVYFPQFLWLAVGGLSHLTREKCQVLAGRKVYLFPDLDGFAKWSSKAQELTEQIPGTFFQVSDLLERHATEADKEKGLDLADYLIKFDYQNFPGT